MKNIFFAAVLALSLNTACGQHLKESAVPAPVKAKFASLHPEIKNAEWGKEGDNYEAEFDVKKVENSVTFDASGNVLETETGIDASALPQGVHDYLAKNLPGKKITEASKITDASGKITYEAEAGGLDYIFDSAGNFIKTVKD